MQLQMHLAMQAQMNLHRQMLDRKVALSQHDYNQAAAAKRVAASALVERAIQNTANVQQPPPSQSSGRYSDPPRYVDSSPSSRPSRDEGGTPQHYQHYQQQQQRYATSSQADALLGPPWYAMDVDMGLQTEEQADLFGFLRSGE